MSISQQLSTEKASAASSKLALKAVSTVALHAQAVSVPEGSGELSFQLTHRPAVWNLVEDELICLFGLTVTIVEKDGESSRTLGNLSLTLRSDYHLLPTFQRGEDEATLPDYAGIVGRLHAWPYFRAETQCLTAKIGLPPLTLPVLVSGHVAKLPVERFSEQGPQGEGAPAPSKKKRSTKGGRRRPRK